VLCESASKEVYMVLQTLNVNRDGAAVLFVEIAAVRIVTRRLSNASN